MIPVYTKFSLNIEHWLNDWVDRHDAPLDGQDDETLAVFAFIAELRPQVEAADQQLREAVEESERLRALLLKERDPQEPGSLAFQVRELSREHRPDTG